ncbi:hypothetical protein L1987_89205 [Smallanthus sonchifolius]|nr:hypothetical protein L1987_89205 [Smallanthus sonchifolius]
MLATAEYSGKTGRHFAESNALRGRFHLLSVSWNEVDPCQSHFTQRSALLFAFILVTYRSEDLMLSLNAYRTAILRYRPLSVVLACSLKLIWWNGNSTPIPLMDPRRRRGANGISIKGAMTTEHANKANSENRLLSQVTEREILAAELSSHSRCQLRDRTTMRRDTDRLPSHT